MNNSIKGEDLMKKAGIEELAERDVSIVGGEAQGLVFVGVL